jgi:hypothetical protein
MSTQLPAFLAHAAPTFHTLAVGGYNHLGRGLVVVDIRRESRRGEVLSVAYVPLAALHGILDDWNRPDVERAVQAASNYNPERTYLVALRAYGGGQIIPLDRSALPPVPPATAA